MFAFFVETFILGLRNLRLHKLRSLLTALGIIFGVSAVIIMVAIGQGAKEAALLQLEKLGATNILIKSVPPPESTEASSRTQRVLEYGLLRDDLERLSTLPGLQRIVPLRDTEQRITYGDVRLVRVSPIGTTHEAFNVINLRLSRGRLFTEVDYEHMSPVCVVGALVAKQYFPLADPLGQKLTVGATGQGMVDLTIVGVLEPTGLRAGSEGAAMMQRDFDQCVFFPLTLAQATFGDAIIKRDAGAYERKQIQLSDIWLQAESVDRVEPLARAAEAILAQPRMRRDFDVKAPIEILRNAERLNRMFNFIMGGTAGISLLVGGIGIMNIMLASVTERTREIGIRRALGAKRRHITLQFLIETTAISLTGGMLGIALGGGMAAGLPSLLRMFGSDEYPTAIAMWSVIASFAVSGLIGIGFGLYPAITAARLNPIEALRHE
jgi:putative ABC transport system permease protein